MAESHDLPAILTYVAQMIVQFGLIERGERQIEQPPDAQLKSAIGFRKSRTHAARASR